METQLEESLEAKFKRSPFLDTAANSTFTSRVHSYHIYYKIEISLRSLIAYDIDH